MSDYMTEYMAKLKQHAKVKTCKVCGKQFQTFVATQVYCSEPCRKIGMEKTRKQYNEKKHPKTEKICVFCHKKFFTRQQNSHQHFCSPECANKYRRILQRIYKIKDYYGSQFDFEAEFKSKGSSFRFPTPFTWLNEWYGLEGGKNG